MKCEPGCTCKRHAAKGTKRDPAIGARISAAKMGHEVSAEARRKIGAASLGRKQSPEQVAARAAAMTRHGHGRRGQARSPEYRAWDGMKQRCLNPNAQRYEDYGGRGITVCERWLTFANFLADMGEKPEPKSHYSIERRDNDCGYGPDNCYWATDPEQQRNRTRFNPVKARKCKPGCQCGKHTAPGRRGYPKQER